ncbi:MAG: molybdopterin-dependent oxidoreductase [Bacteroidota bacterium]
MRYESFKTTCSYCGVGCGIIVKKDGRNRLKVEGNPDHPVNKGMLCSKGMNLHHVVQDTSDRLTQPMMRWSRNHPMEAVDWDTALNRAAAVFKSIIKKHGPDSVGFYVSGQCTTEEYYLVNKLTKGFIGTNNVDTNSRLCMSSAVVGYKKALGEDSVPISYDDIELADTFLIAGANPAWCHPILFRRLEQHKEKNPNTKIVIVDPRKTQTCSIADLHLQIKPGTDVVLFNAICRRIIENGHAHFGFIENHTEGFDAFRQMVMQTTLTEAANICGVSVKEIRVAASYIGESKGFISMWAMGLNQSVIGVDKNLALLNISLLTGQIGKPGAGPFSLTGQPNAMGGREVGGMANLLAAHKVQSNPKHRAEVAKFWGVKDLPSKPGLTATRMFEGLATGKLKAIWIICTNPLVSLPDARMMDKALKNARFVVVQDISDRSDTAAYADLQLPAAGWLEKAGTMTNSDRRISYLPKVVDAPGQAKPDAEILWTFAQKMGYHGFNYQSVSEVYDEHCRLTKGTNIDISGLNHERLQKEGTFQWPVPYNNHQGTPRLFTDKKFYTTSQKAFFNLPVHHKNRSESVNTDFPLILITGRLRDQWHTMTRTGKVNKLKQHRPFPFLEISPRDARYRNLVDGELAVISSRRGEVRVKIKVTDTIRDKVVFLPMHWGKKLNNDFRRANNLTNNLLDDYSSQPDFKYSAVQVKPYQKGKQKIVLIGAGAAAFEFVKQYRRLNTEDEIHVFSKEAYPFYNRILLPEYVSEHLAWEQLEKIKSTELSKLNLTIHRSKSIENIERSNRTVTDSDGQAHSYDLLIMATGSRPFIPREVPVHLSGVFTMRSRTDAERLKKYLKDTELPAPDQHVVIVGGGLLGLEMAAALKTINVKVTIIQRAARLMERQLDTISSALLAEDVAERDITTYFDNEVSTVTAAQGPNQLKVSLKSGLNVRCNAIVYAIGTRPNVELAKETGLKVKRGVVVNEYLQTSDPTIFAIGEIAEFRQRLYGITSAAELQARTLAGYLSGDLNSSYEGSVLMNVLKFENLDLCSIGQITIPDNSTGYEEVVFKDISQRYYKKCIIHQDRMVGAILVGDKAEFPEYKRLIESRIELSEKRTELLRNSTKKEPVIGKLVCSCNNVGRGNIEKAMLEGYTTLGQICEKTGAGTACGSCKPEVKDILNQKPSKLPSIPKKAMVNGSSKEKRGILSSLFR